MLSWSISTALKCSCFDQIIVSTEDDEISSIAKSCGALVPFVRPSSLANDYATTQEVISHSVSWYQDSGQP